MRDYLTVGLGVDTKLDDNMTLRFDYQTSFGFDGNAQSHTFGIRLGGSF
ncbi:MAG: autotransporter outer membrane beta-barrel domain-containing protein [Rhizobiales bacterium]|nr:autotransporter outer membrane beta-barrel domain-containing protein [Hyphomicrobiales bacterium]